MRQKVGHVRLVLEHHQRRNVGISGEKSLGVEPPIDRRQRRRGHRLRELRGGLNDRDVTHVAQRDRLSGDVPSAPPLVDRRPVIGDQSARVGILVVRHRKGAERHQARDGKRVPGQVAGEALGAPLELWLRGRLLFRGTGFH